MHDVLLVNTPASVAAQLRKDLPDVSVAEETAEEKLQRALDQKPGDLGALILGPQVEAPIRLAEQARAADPDLAVLILCERTRRPRLLEELRFSGFVGAAVDCVLLPMDESFSGLVRKAVIQTRQRRRHRGLLAAVEVDARIASPRPLLDALAQSEERFRAIFEQASVGVAEIETATGRFIRINQRYCDLVGIRAKDIKARTFMSITYPADLPADLENMERLKAGAIREFSMEKRYIRPDGEIVWVDLNVSPLWPIGAHPSRHIAVVQDITGRKRAEDALRASEERFRLAVETARDAIVTIDVESRILSVNRATEIVFGYSDSELVGQPLTVLMPQSLQETEMTALLDYIKTGRRRLAWHLVEFKGRKKSGREIPLEVSFGEFVSAGTRVCTGILRDISERKREEARVLAEKETLEKLAAFTTRVNSAMTLEAVLDQMFETFHTVIPYDRMGCAFVDSENRTARSVWARSSSAHLRLPVGYSASLEGSSLRGLLESARPRILNDLEGYLREHPASESTRRIVEEGMRSSLTCPLVANGRSVGFLFFSSMQPHTYADAHVEVYLRVAEHLSCILEKARLYQEVVDTKREVELRNRFIAKVFGRYTSDAIVSELLESPSGLEIGGETREVTLVLADLSGFTPLCAKLNPQRVVRLLNIYLEVMTDVIMSHGGTIDEILGDAILAVFGVPVRGENDARQALACSIAMQQAMQVVKRRLSKESLPVLQMGIAVHTGEVVVGNIGSTKRAKYGIVGTAINLASRIEACASGGQILCSEDTMRAVGNIVDFDERLQLRLRGLPEPVVVFSVRGLRAQPAESPASGTC